MRPTDREPAHQIETRQEKTRAIILKIEQRKLRFFEQRDGGELRDVTADRLD